MSSFSSKKIVIVISALILLIFSAGAALAGPRISYLFKRPKIECNWQDLGQVPLAEKEYPPQGLTFWDNSLIFSNHWQDTASGLYQLDPHSMKIVAESKMPLEASHTSGLTHDGTWLWAADYNSNKIYKIDLKKSFEDGAASVVESYPTGLKGTSALTFIRWKNRSYFAISDFFHSGQTYLIEADKISELNTSSTQTLAAFSYDNDWFSQGLTWDGTYLYESVNNIGIDRIRVLFLDDWLSGKSSEPCLIAEISFGGPAAEDLATDGSTLWSSDEITYEFVRIEEYAKYIPEKDCP